MSSYRTDYDPDDWWKDGDEVVENCWQDMRPYPAQPAYQEEEYEEHPVSNAGAGWIRFFAILAATLLVVSFALLCRLVQEANGAPAPTKPAEIVGTFEYGTLHSPQLILFRDNEKCDYWLVFTDPATEVQAHKIEPGARAKVQGKTGAGGGYRYIVVASIEPE